MDVVERKLQEGLVLHLDPVVLSEEGAQCEGSPVAGPHFFVCVLVDDEGDQTFWIPTSSKSGRGRLAVPPSSKSGHPGWVQHPTYVVSHQIWVASKDAIREAAYLDESRETSPNRVLPEGMERILDGLR